MGDGTDRERRRRQKAAVERFVSIYILPIHMRLRLSKNGLRHDFGEGLLTLSTIGVMLLSIFLVTDSLGQRLSILRLILFGLSIGGAALGGFLLKSSAKAQAAILGGILIAAMFEATVMASVHPTRPGTVTVPHPEKDLGKGLVRAIRKQAGLK